MNALILNTLKPLKYVKQFNLTIFNFLILFSKCFSSVDACNVFCCNCGGACRSNSTSSSSEREIVSQFRNYFQRPKRETDLDPETINVRTTSTSDGGGMKCRKTKCLNS